MIEAMCEMANFNQNLLFLSKYIFLIKRNVQSLKQINTIINVKLKFSIFFDTS